MRAQKWWGLRLRQQRFSLKLFLAFLAVLAVALAQDASFLSPDVIRVGAKLACRCGGCRNTVGDCPMIRCSSADPMRHRIYNMKSKGMSDGDIVNSIVREEGIVALASPPAAGVGPIMTWIMPGLVLVMGLFVYLAFVRRHRKEPVPLTEVDEKLIERYRAQIDRELEENDRQPGQDAKR
jgi:cytochrome c-type biogenesis protein CcmH/NrfF